MNTVLQWLLHKLGCSTCRTKYTTRDMGYGCHIVDKEEIRCRKGRKLEAATAKPPTGEREKT